jgi:predicted secreted protein
MANHTGSEGVVKIGANTVAEVRSYSISETADTIEDTSMGDSARTYKSVLKSFSGSMDVFWDETDSAQIAMVVGAQVTLALYPEGASSGVSEKYLTGDVIITGKTINGSFDGMVESSITFQGTGALTLSTLA